MRQYRYFTFLTLEEINSLPAETEDIIYKEIYPINVRPARENFKKNEADRRWAFENSLSGDFLINNDNDDFNYFLDLLEGEQDCKKIPLYIYQRCGTGENYTLWREATINLTKGVWDYDKCILNILPDLKNEYTCLEENFEKEINLLDGTFSPQTVKYLKGTITYLSYTSSNYDLDDPAQFSGNAPSSLAWKCYKVTKTINGTPPGIYEFFYAREELTLPCAENPGDEWIEINDNCPTDKDWARLPLLADYKTGTIIKVGGGPFTTEEGYLAGPIFENKIMGVDFIGNFDNGILFNDIVKHFANIYCGLNVVSEFFQINPAGSYASTYPALEARTAAFEMIFQKSDVKRPGDANNATKALTTFKEILVSVLSFYNCYYRIENGILVIEHVSFFQSQPSIDLTATKYKDRLKGSKIFTFITDKIPKFEKFTNPDNLNIDFVSSPIEYFGDLVSDDKKNSTKTNTAENISTDVENLLVNSSGDSSKVSDEGLAMLACYLESGEYFIRTVSPILDTQRRINNALSWAYLLASFHKHYRLLRWGYLNGSLVEFESSQPVKKRKKISIPFCCDESINLLGYFITDTGNAYVESASFIMYGEEIELDLVYLDITGNYGCVKPKSFKLLSVSTGDYKFETFFESSSTYTTQIEILQSDGTKTILTLLDDENGERITNFSGLASGITKFRKRIVCGLGCYSPWTEWVSFDNSISPPDCSTLDIADIIFVGIVNCTFTFSFDVNIEYPVEVEASAPLIQQIFNAQIVKIGGLTRVIITTVGFPCLPGIEFNFRFRQKCGDLYSAWSAIKAVTI